MQSITPKTGLTNLGQIDYAQARIDTATKSTQKVERVEAAAAVTNRRDDQPDNAQAKTSGPRNMPSDVEVISPKSQAATNIDSHAVFEAIKDDMTKVSTFSIDEAYLEAQIKIVAPTNAEELSYEAKKLGRILSEQGGGVLEALREPTKDLAAEASLSALYQTSKVTNDIKLGFERRL